MRKKCKKEYQGEKKFSRSRESGQEVTVRNTGILCEPTKLLDEGHKEGDSGFLAGRVRLCSTVVERLD